MSDTKPETCTCGAPETYSLREDEVIVHRADGPCYFSKWGQRDRGHRRTRYRGGHQRGVPCRPMERPPSVHGVA